jgi:hypothetical protein
VLPHTYLYKFRESRDQSRYLTLPYQVGTVRTSLQVISGARQNLEALRYTTCRGKHDNLASTCVRFCANQVMLFRRWCYASNVLY